MQSPEFAVVDDRLNCQYCRKTLKNVGGRIEHEKWCKDGPRLGHGDAPHDDQHWHSVIVDDGDLHCVVLVRRLVSVDIDGNVSMCVTMLE